METYRETVCRSPEERHTSSQLLEQNDVPTGLYYVKCVIISLVWEHEGLNWV